MTDVINVDLDALYSGWSAATASAWAKLDAETGASLPLFCHLADAAATADWLWKQFLPEAVRSTLSASLGSDDAAHAAVVFAAGVHDVGKLTPAFARKAELAGKPFAVTAMQRAGLRFPMYRGDVPHGLTGHVAVVRWLEDRHGYRRPRAHTIATVVGGHHGKFPSSQQLLDARRNWAAFGDRELEDDELVECLWHRSRFEILDRVATAATISPHLESWKPTGWTSETQVLVSAVVILADWLASNVDYFPYHSIGPGRVQRAIDAVRLPHPWRPSQPPDIDRLFTQRFPHLSGLAPSPLQRAAVQAAESATSPPLIVIEAPMGAGKTEAAYLAAETLAHRFGSGGLFIGLPTMATANPMFDRVLDWLGTTLTDDASVMLAHSKSAHQDRFQGLLNSSRFRQIHDEDTTASRAMVATWLTGRKKATQASFVVGTVDQLLLMGLQAKHVTLRHLAMAGKVVVVDECHASDDYMRVYLRRALTWLARMGTPVILMSATLPPEQRHEYLAAYAAGRAVSVPELPPTLDYPLLSVFDTNADSIAVAADGRSACVTMRRIPDDMSALAADLDQRLADGGCAAIIRNTVQRAQETFAALQEVLGDDIMLIHSRFIAQHRARLERDLVARLGRDGERPHRIVVVGTQVLEQSLDVDFDIMVTDLAPMDLLLQRAGRLHRHDRISRPISVSTPMLLVTGADWSTVPPQLDKGSAYVYGSAKLLRAAALLQERDTIARFPEDIPRLVEAAYSNDPGIPPGWECAWREAEERQREKTARQQDKAGTYLIRTPDQQNSLVGFSDFDATDPESPRSKGKQQVRDATDGLDVVVLQRGADGLLRLPNGIDAKNRVIPEHPLEDIENGLARDMNATTLSLPPALAQWHFDEVERALGASLDYTAWDRSPWLQGQLALVLDTQGEALVAQFHLIYDPRMGLMYTTENGSP